VPAFREARFAPPEPESFASQAGGNAANLGDLFEVCVAEGYLVRITPEIYLHADVETEMRQKVAEGLSSRPAGLTVAEIRDLLGTTRKYAVPLCEYLDRVGVTKRVGDVRVASESPS
jgi:selenocysteine-specific elongation factor